MNKTASAATQGRPLPLSASQLVLGPCTPSAAHPQHAGGAEGSEEALSPRPAGEVDAEAAMEWQAHVTAQLRAQVAAELQVRQRHPPFVSFFFFCFFFLSFFQIPLLGICYG